MLEKFKPLHVANTHSPTRRCHVRLRERNTNPKRRGLAARRGVRPGPRARCERVTRLGAQRVGSAPPPATRPALRCFLARRRGPALPRGAPRLLGAALLHRPPPSRVPLPTACAVRSRLGTHLWLRPAQQQSYLSVTSSRENRRSPHVLPRQESVKNFAQRGPRLQATSSSAILSARIARVPFVTLRFPPHVRPQ